MSRGFVGVHQSMSLDKLMDEQKRRNDTLGLMKKGGGAQAITPHDSFRWSRVVLIVR